MLSKNKDFEKENSGQAMVEFVIVFPVLFLLFMVIIQTALLYVAKQIVNYAAFSVARSAIVWIPSAETEDVKKEKIERAGALACIPISPNLNTTLQNGLSTNVLQAGQGLFNLYRNCPGLAAVPIQNIPGLNLFNNISNANTSGLLDPGLNAALLALGGLIGHNTDLVNKYPMSRILTTVGFYDSSGNIIQSPFTISGSQDITVEVTHNYALRIPIINRLFYTMYMRFLLRRDIENAMGSHLSALALNCLDEALDDFLSSTSLPLYTIPIRARCTLTIEGEVGAGNCC